MSTLLVVGSAPCFADDLRRAQALRPGAQIMLVNGAGTLVEEAQHLLSGHTDKAELFTAARRAKFPWYPVEVHATARDKDLPEMRKLYPSVTRWHDKAVCVRGTSASKAAMIGLLKMNMDEVILCGCPLNGGGYAEGETKVTHFGLRIGDDGPTKFMVTAGGDRLLVQNAPIIVAYRKSYRALSETVFKGRVFSMSGFTMACSGEPR